MKKKLLIVIVFILNVCVVNGQKAAKHINKHRVCHVETINNESLDICRVMRNDIIIPLSRSNLPASKLFLDLENQLDWLKNASKRTSYFEFDEKNIRKSIDTIKYLLPDLNVEPYEKEVVFYSKIYQMRKQEQDSIKLVEASKREAYKNRNTTSEVVPKNIWDQLDTDSASFYRDYGTPKEYFMQEDLRLTSNRQYGHAVVLGGMKFYWYNELSVYIQKMGYNSTSFDGKDGNLIMKYEEGMAINRSPSKLTVTANLDKEGRMKKITISGDFDPLSQIFISYWRLTNISLNEIKTKGIITRNFISDKITWSWNNNKPVIVIASSSQ